ncbi:MULTISPECIES: hypothetical protein [Bacillales]|uniref:Uncharacterized protein n=1 Tax=Lysinibacillus halotolerans TaxID=1368476 RepID=A0A3M8H5A0_9BACI|nr:hypothetical protein [Lysinibacillus halotolerans]RNC97605.1 hypothetical protein EC501_14385 [Lysinibacillus halotolerans]
MKKLFLVFSCLIMVFGFSITSSQEAKALSGNEPTYTYWMQSSSSLIKTTYGSWVTRTAYTHGPATKTYSYETSTSWSVESYAELSYNEIKSGLKSSFTSTKKITDSMSCSIPKNKKGAYQTRDVYNHYKVKLQEWISVDGRKSKTGKTKTVTIKKKVGLEDRCNLINK